jgi:uncharacterized membrane protein YgcG
MKILKMKNPNAKWILNFLLICILLLQVNSGFSQYKIPEIPTLQTSVYDYASVLSASEKAQLEEKLIKYSDSTTTQIVVVTIPSLEGENVSQLATRWGQTWGIGGTAKDDNGVIILLAKAEKKIAINPGYGLEDRLTAGLGGEIIRNVIIPEFKAGSYFNGLDKGTDEIFKVFNGKYKGERKQNKSKKNIPIFPIIIFTVIVLIILSRRKNNGNNGNNTGGDIASSLLDVIILSSLGRGSGGGFGGGSSSGGGFGGGGFGGGFGGGGFSGGGSSGSW